MKTIQESLEWGADYLAVSPSPRIEAEILLRFVLGCDRHELYLRTQPLSDGEFERFREAVRRRGSHEPLQYITGVQSFRSEALEVGPGVLVPRPETEIVVEYALGTIADLSSPIVVDVGTGSGAIALSILSERPDARIWATEISEEALAWAERNRKRLGAESLKILLGDLLEPLPGKLRSSCDLIVSNPPYISEEQIEDLPEDVRDFEPKIATVSGKTGLEVAARIVESAAEWLRPGGWVVMETSPYGAGRLEALLKGRYEDVSLAEDLTGAVRVAMGRNSR